MDTEERQKKIIGIIIDQLSIDDPAEVVLEASFIDDLGADSLDLVELIMALEEEFDLTFLDEEAEGIKTVGKAIEHVQNKLS